VGLKRFSVDNRCKALCDRKKLKSFEYDIY
jgi:hypothetical protein